MTSDQRRIIGYMAAVMAILCILLIWRFSLEDGDRSGGRSAAIIELVTRYLPAAITANSELILRKAAHFLEYALLSAILTSAFLCFNKPISRYFPHVLLPCLLAAVVDETIQSFVPGRGSSTVDVLIDFAGAVLALLVTAFIGHLHKRRRDRFL